MDTSGGASHVRCDWFTRAINTCQMFAGTASAADRDAFQSDVERLLNGIDDPQNTVEREMLNALLSNVATRATRDLHRQYHRERPGPCDFMPPGEGWVPDPINGPKGVFRVWASAFIEAFDRHHPLPPAHRARRIIERRFQSRVLLDALAREVGVCPAALSASFKATFGMTPWEYQKRLQVLTAVRLLRADRPVACVAAEVGYTTRSHFYETFQRLTGRRPAEVRGLPPAVFEALWDRLQRGVCDPPAR